jgi:pyruvate dehydrogenase kinase 2/3/4
MRGDFSSGNTLSIPGEPRGLTRSAAGNGSIAAKSMNLSMRAMKLKLSGKLNKPDVSPRKQVGEMEAMLGSGEKPWWKNVGMDEGM